MTLGRRRYLFGSPQFYPEVSTFANLPSASGNTGRIYIVTTGSWSGLWYYRPGLYRSDGSSWVRLAPLTTVSDEVFALYDEGDNTKGAAFECGSITSGTTRTFTFPDASGTLVLSGSAEHNRFSDYVANEHISWVFGDGATANFYTSASGVFGTDFSVGGIGTAGNFWIEATGVVHIYNSAAFIATGTGAFTGQLSTSSNLIVSGGASIGSGGTGVLSTSLLTVTKSSTSSTLTNAADLGFDNLYTGAKANLRGAIIGATHRPDASAIVTTGYGIDVSLTCTSADDSSTSPKITTGIAGDFGIEVGDGDDATGNPEITTGYVVRAKTAVKSALGVLTTVCSFYDQGQTAASTNWGFYGLSANNYLSGRLVFEDITNKDVYVSSEAAGYLDLAAPTGIRLNQNINITGEARCDSFRIDQAAAVDAQTDGTHTITISANGTNYKLLAVAA